MRASSGPALSGSVLTVLLAASLVTACAPGTSGDDGGSQGGNELTYVYFTDGPDEQATRDLIAQFEERTGASVELQIVPFDNLEQQLQARLSGGNAPDVARLTNLVPFRGDLLDLRAAGQDIGDEFLDVADEYVTGPNGELQAVPSDLTMNGPLVNTDQFEAAGVPLPSADDPWTWDELVAGARQVQQANGTEYALAFDKSGHRLAGLFSQFGTDYFAPDGSVELDRGRATEAVTLFTDLHRQGAMPADFWLESGTRYEGANDIFLAQDVPVYISGNWQVSQFAETADFGWAAIPNPCAERCGGFPGGKFMAAFQQSDNQELAAEFIAFMNSRQSQEQFARASLFLPTRTDLIESGIEYPQRSADMNVFLADVRATPEDAYPSYFSPAFDTTAQAVVEEMGAAIADQQSPAETVDRIREEAQAALEATG